jgi:peptide-methionine (S)-S-oxide reductase
MNKFYKALSLLSLFLLGGIAIADTAATANTKTELATFAGGCFWCMETVYDGVPGVSKVVSGYIGGTVANPTYEQVSAGKTGHAEAVQVTFDPAVIAYSKLLSMFWQNIDPTVKNRQFCDVGDQYRTAIFTHSAQQLQLADASKAEVLKQYPNMTIYTQIVDAGPFYPAEDYHQQYHEKNPLRYKLYRANCGRDQRLEELWKAPKP